MAFYKLRCEAEFPNTPEGLAEANRLANEMIASEGTSGYAQLHLCRHDEDPSSSCGPYIVNIAWGGAGDD